MKQMTDKEIMTNEEAINYFKRSYASGDTDDERQHNEAIDIAIKAIKALEQTRWIPIKTRPLTEEEKEELGHEYAYMYDCPLPDDGQDVLVTDYLGNVEIDTFCRDYEGFYFETNCDDGEVIAWMPKPHPYKAEGSESE